MDILNSFREMFGKKMFRDDNNEKQSLNGVQLSLDEIAELLKTTPEAVEEFERAYHAADFAKGLPDNYFKVNAKQAVGTRENDRISNEWAEDITKRIVNEFIAQTIVYSYEKEKGQSLIDYTHCIIDAPPVTLREIRSIAPVIWPQCTGRYMVRDIPETGKALLYNLKQAMISPDEEKRRTHYHLFRQGLDILDLDELTYSMIDNNATSMGNWLPRMAGAVSEHGFFKIPDTKIIKVPITMLQVIKQFDYQSLSMTTLDIVNNYCHEVFGLDDNGKYFIKTGVRCSKQDFRNAVIEKPKEVREVGGYFLFLHQQAIRMASPLSSPCIYGAGTTVEWVVREYIEDVEDNPTIYHGMPLHTEYRVFVDFDTKEVLGIHNYWDPDLMLKHFAERAKNPKDVDAKHDYVTYKRNMDRLVERYEHNKKTVADHVADFLPKCIGMTGHWSIDIMQNGNDFWFIDAAQAEISMFYKETVPEEKRKPSEEHWSPNVSLPALMMYDIAE